MKRKILISSMYFILLLFIFCATPGEQLRERNPELYRDIIGKWYILSNDNLGEVQYTLSFNEDGTITGDVQSLFHSPNAEWSAYDQFLRKGYVLIRRFYGEEHGLYSITYTNNTAILNDPWTKCNKYYINSVPPLKIMRIERRLSLASQIVADSNYKSFIFTHDLSDLESLKKKTEDIQISDRNKWESINKNSINQHFDFIKSVQDPDLKKTAEDSLSSLLDSKIHTFIKKNYKDYSRYADYPICYEAGDQICLFYEIFRLPILAMTNSGEKINFRINKNNSYVDGFDLILNAKRSECIMTFKPFRNKLYVMGLVDEYNRYNPRGWETAIGFLMQSMCAYPSEGALNIELLEQLQ